MITAANVANLASETAFAVLGRATELQARGRSIINLGIGQPDFKTPEHIVEAGIRALREGHHGYTPAPGCHGPARGGRRRCLAPQGHGGLAPAGHDRGGRQDDDVLRHPDARRAGHRNPLSHFIPIPDS